MSSAGRLDNISQFSDEDEEYLLNKLDDEQLVYLAPAILIALIVIIVGGVGNLLILYIFPHHIKRSSTNYFVLALAYYDLVVCLLIMPMDIYVTHKTYNNRNVFLCKIYRLITNTVLEGSCFVMAFVGVDRYIKVFRPFYRIPGSLIKWVSFLLGFVALFLNLPFAFLLFGVCRVETSIPGLKGYRCLYTEGTQDSVVELIFALSLAFIFVSLSVLLAYCYGSIFCFVRKRKRMTIGATMSRDMRNRLNTMADKFHEENNPTSFYSLPSGSAVNKASLPLEKKCAPADNVAAKHQAPINAVTSLDSGSSAFSKLEDIAVNCSATSPDTSLSKSIPLLQPADNVAAKHQALDNRVQMEVDDQPASSVLPAVGHTADMDCKSTPPVSSEAVGVGSKNTFMSDKAFLKTKLPVQAEVPSTSSEKPRKSILHLRKSEASEADMETIRATKLSEKGVGKVEVADIHVRMSVETSKDVPFSGETSASHKGCDNTGKTETSRDEPQVFGEGEGTTRETKSCHKHVTIALETEECHTDATIPRETEASQEDVVTPGETEASNKPSKTPGETERSNKLSTTSTETEASFLGPPERARISSTSPGAAGQTRSDVNTQWNPISQTTVSLFFITLTFFICNITSIILVFLQPSKNGGGSSWVNLSSELRFGIRAAIFKVAFLRHAINPLIYFFRQPKFRKHTKEVLRSVTDSKCCQN